MPTFTELLPVTKSSKHSGLNWTPSDDDFAPTAGTLVVWTDRTTATYAVTEFPTGWRGRGFVLAKVGGADRYDVFCSADGPEADSCDCAGTTYAGRCKHRDAVRALVGNGWL